MEDLNNGQAVTMAAPIDSEPTIFNAEALIKELQASVELLTQQVAQKEKAITSLNATTNTLKNERADLASEMLNVLGAELEEMIDRMVEHQVDKALQDFSDNGYSGREFENAIESAVEDCLRNASISLR